MRFLILHVNALCSTITEKGRSQVYEDYHDPVTKVDNALVVLASVEQGDEANPDCVARRASGEIAKLANQVKASTIVLHPVAHLFATLGSPQDAIDILDRTHQSLLVAKHDCTRTPFGWFNTLQMDAKGHPLSRVARIVTAED